MKKLAIFTVLMFCAILNQAQKKTTYFIEVGQKQEFQAAFTNDTLNAQWFYESVKIDVYKDEQEIEIVIAQEECRAWIELPYINGIRQINAILDDGNLIYLEGGEVSYIRPVRVSYVE